MWDGWKWPGISGYGAVSLFQRTELDAAVRKF